MSGDLPRSDCAAWLSLGGVWGVQKAAKVLGAGTTVLIAPTCGEVWNQKLGKFLHVIFLIITKVKWALYLTRWLWWSLSWRVWGKRRLSLLSGRHRNVCERGRNLPLTAKMPNLLWNLLILNENWHFLMTWCSPIVSLKRVQYLVSKYQFSITVVYRLWPTI